MPPRDTSTPTASPLYRAAASVAFAVMDVQRWRFDVRGLEHLPRTGGAVLAANHNSFWDFFAVGRPGYRRLGRPVRILAKESLFRTPVFGYLMRKAGHIPVHRGSGARALRSAIAAVERGEFVLVLPEQTISPSFELRDFKSGAARIAMDAGAPLIPVASWGTHRFHTVGRWPRWRWRLPVTVSFGRPMRPRRDQDVRAVTEELRRRVGRLLDDAIRTYPDGAPAGAWWVPARFGGGAPRPDEAEQRIAHVTRWFERGRRSG